MKTHAKALLVGVLASALSAPAFAYTINGVIPPGATPVVIHLPRPSRPILLRFTFIAPRKNAGVRYALNFCVGLAANPCGQPTSRVINVPEGQSRNTTFDSNIFNTRILVVGQGTRVAVPYSVRVN
ncbi:MAG TPA: hypothetical protein VN814_07060 [Caulobacteraceae bacterium]|nr:hypothetical protein [Caulobacteraceae bacterium]